MQQEKLLIALLKQSNLNFVSNSQSHVVWIESRAM